MNRLSTQPNTDSLRRFQNLQQWVQRSQRGKRPERLVTKKAAGATPKLDQKQRATWVKRWQAGPVAAGFLSQLWTGPRVAELIGRKFGVTYHANYLPARFRSLVMTAAASTPTMS